MWPSATTRFGLWRCTRNELDIYFSNAAIRQIAQYAGSCKYLECFCAAISTLTDVKFLKKPSILAMYLLFTDCEGKPRQMRSYSSTRLFAILTVLSLSATNVQAQTVAATESKAIRSPGDGNLNVVASADSWTSAGSSQFTLGVADVLRVNVWKNTDLSQTVTVGPDGFVSLPLLGDVHVAGMTAKQLAQSLSSRLNAYVVSAEVTVSVVEIRSRQVYVMGQVAKPGEYSLVAPITVLQLIAQAGGLSTFAKRKEIFVLRGTKENVQRLKFNYVNAIRGDVHQNIDLQPGDTVVVP
jgi:polysaccharide biosynthesis/export protein